MVTGIECFEHFVDPMTEIKEILSYSRNIIFTTELLPYPIPKPNEWWYYGLNHGQHISFYSERTLKFIARMFNLNYLRIGPMHIYSDKKFSSYKIKLLKLLVKLKLLSFDLHKLITLHLNSKTFSDSKYLSEVK